MPIHAPVKLAHASVRYSKERETYWFRLDFDNDHHVEVALPEDPTRVADSLRYAAIVAERGGNPQEPRT